MVREIHELSPDVEGGLDQVWSDLLEGDWVAVRAEDNRFKIHEVPNGSDSSRALDESGAARKNCGFFRFLGRKFIADSSVSGNVVGGVAAEYRRKWTWGDRKEARRRACEPNNANNSNGRMTMAYELEGRLLEACTCEGSCPCWAGYGPNEDCHTVLSWHIDSGTIEGVDVSGRTVAVVGDVACSVFNQEDSSVALYVDDQAAPQQEEALLNAWTGSLGGPVADLARLFGEVTSTGRAPITVTADEGGGRLEIGQEIQADTSLLREAEGRRTSIEESVLSAAPGATADWSEDPRSQEYNAVQASFRFEA